MAFQSTDGDTQPTRPLDRQTRKLVARIARDQSDVEAIEALAEHYTRRSDYAALANLMESHATTLTEAHAAADTYVRAADAALLDGDRKRAELLYECALTREPAHAGALDRALRVAEAARDAQAMLRIVHSALGASQADGADPALTSTLHMRLGQIYELHVRDYERAADQYRTAMAENPQLIQAAAAARRLYAQAGNHDAVSVLYELEIDTVTDVDDQRVLLMALAEHKSELCGDIAGAIAALQRAFELQAGDVATLRKLADAWLVCSEQRTGVGRQAAQQQAAQALFRLAGAVARGEAAALLERALALDPEHAQAAALLQELRSHADAPSSHDQPRAADSLSPEVQLGPDKRDTLKMFAAETESQTPHEEIEALSTSDLLPVDASDSSIVSSGSSSFAARPPRQAQKSSSLPPPFDPNTVPKPKSVIPVSATEGTCELSLAELELVSVPPPLPDLTSRAQVVETLPLTGKQLTITVELGAATDSNLYVNINNRLLDGGVFVATHDTPTVGMTVLLYVLLPDNVAAQALGRVSLLRDLDSFDDGVGGAYIAFEALTRESLSLLGRFAAKRLPLLVDDT